IDRLSREDLIDALQTILFDLIAKGVVIQLLDSKITLDKSAMKDWRINFLISELQRAHAESRRKADLWKDNWTRKRQGAAEGRTVETRNCPAWLRITGDRPKDKSRVSGGRFEAIPEAAKAIRLLFKLRAEGLGWRTICQRLNREAA